jgi:N-acetyl-gamma-glutamyl-phosphate reductase
MQQARSLLDAGVRVIDLAADFRIQDIVVWEKWYGMTHACPDLVEEAVYGLPEINRDKIKGARLIANPGCYPTAVQLGFLPLLEAGVVDKAHLIADAKSGVSGAGRKAEVHTLFSEASDNFKAYGVPGHRHLPEISQGLGRMAGAPVGLTFVPHLTPAIRGIHATLYARITRETDFQALFEKRYAAEAFRALRAPVVIVVGDRSPDVTRRIAERVAEQCRNGRVEILPGANHALTTTHAEAVAGYVAGAVS